MDIKYIKLLNTEDLQLLVSNVEKKSDLTYQKKLTAGDNITITDDNVISAATSKPIVLDTLVTSTSTNGVESSGIYAAVSAKMDNMEAGQNVVFTNDKKISSLTNINNHDGSGDDINNESSYTITEVGVSLNNGEIFNDYVNNQSIGDYSHAEGTNTVSSGNSSHSEGTNTQANGEASHCEGMSSAAKGDFSHAEGQNTVASGSASHSEGLGVQSKGDYSHAEGQGSIASGISSHAEGQGSQSNGLASHAEGTAVANGIIAHAEGTMTSAIGNSSHSEGVYTISMGDVQHVQGKYNIADNTSAFILGNGTSTTARSNAMTVDWSGNMVLEGELTDTKTYAIYESTEAILVLTGRSQCIYVGSTSVDVTEIIANGFYKIGDTLTIFGNGTFMIGSKTFTIKDTESSVLKLFYDGNRFCYYV